MVGMHIYMRQTFDLEKYYKKEPGEWSSTLQAYSSKKYQQQKQKKEENDSHSITHMSCANGKGSAHSVLFSTTFNSALNGSLNEWKSIMSGQRKRTGKGMK